MRPQQRTWGLIVTKAGSDLIVFDEQALHLHTIPAPVAAVWLACDGRTTPEELGRCTGLPSLQVETALLHLAEANLLAVGADRPLPGQDRRALLKRAALGAAIVSVTVPMAVAAQSTCAPAGAPCDFGRPDLCCSQTCVFANPVPVCQ